jgi:glycosyltransferase involved in cell wall biosynthesis
MAKIRRILLECTATHQSGINTGIQRVVRNIVNHGPQVCKELEFECIPVEVRFNRFWRLSGTSISGRARVFLRGKAKACYTLCKRIGKKLFPFAKGRPAAAISRSLFALFTLCDALLGLIFFPLSWFFYKKNIVIPKEGDIILLLDSSWIHSIWPAVKKAKTNNAQISLLVYDLIPLLHRHLFPTILVDNFERWFQQSTGLVDQYIAISKTVREDIKEHLSDFCPELLQNKKFDSFNLAPNLDWKDQNGLVRNEIEALFSPTTEDDVYLFIGTIEPRKNHSYLLDTFSKLWSEGSNSRLCIIGRIGWKCEEILERIRTHDELGKKLFMFNDATDTELEYCYHHSKALVYPSIAEGYGLPIIESLFHKLPVLASNTPIHREVGGDFCSYFDLENPESLSQEIAKIETTGQMPVVKPIDSFEQPSWEDSCRELLTKVVQIEKPCCDGCS